MTYLLVVCLVLACNITIIHKHVIGCRGVGFFSEFFGALCNLDYSEKHSLVPVIYWGSNSLYWSEEKKSNAWDYYFEPVSPFYYGNGDVLWRHYESPDNRYITTFWKSGISKENMQKQRVWANTIIKKYIRIKPHIQKKIDDFFSRHIQDRYTVGVHIRGTDKKEEVNPLDVGYLIRMINKYKENHFPEAQFFVATDEQRILDQCKKELQGNVISYDCQRSDNGLPLHRVQGDTTQNGEDVLIEVLLLSRCNFFMHTSSNVSWAVLFFNLNLENIQFLPSVGFS
jgi:hypothetical protein